MTKRPSLAGLEARLQPKRVGPAEAATPEAPPAGGKVEAAPARRAGQRNPNVKTAMIRIDPEGWKALRRLSIELDTPLDDLLIEAANDLLRRHGEPAIVQKRGRPPA